jgi:S1-C subfamily serine protease
MSENSPVRRSGSPRHHMARAVGTAALALLLLGTGAGVGIAFANPRGAAVAAPSATPSANPPNTAAIAHSVDPGVVDITSTVGSGRLSGEALGTGLLLTSAGMVVTNNHVIDGATSIQVHIAGRAGTHPARVIGADAPNDVALLQLEGVSGLPTIVPGGSSPAVGDGVVAIGNALGLGGAPTVSNGTVTALGRSIEASDPAGGGTEALSGLIQTDSPIQPGDSGGALVNLSGQVVGLITAAATGTSTRSASGVGFAIPIANIMTIVNQIRSGPVG